MEHEFKITSAKHYEETMITIFEWQEQEEPLSEEQAKKLKQMLLAAEQYEKDEL